VSGERRERLIELLLNVYSVDLRHPDQEGARQERRVIALELPPEDLKVGADPSVRVVVERDEEQEGLSPLDVL
jgi:hypothetical protein